MKNSQKIMIPVTGNEHIYKGFMKVAEEIMARQESNSNKPVGTEFLPGVKPA